MKQITLTLEDDDFRMLKRGYEALARIEPADGTVTIKNLSDQEMLSVGYATGFLARVIDNVKKAPDINPTSPQPHRAAFPCPASERRTE